MDRNLLVSTLISPARLSLSARRAWIEIDVQPLPEPVTPVALRKESVDRNPDSRG